MPIVAERDGHDFIAAAVAAGAAAYLTQRPRRHAARRRSRSRRRHRRGAARPRPRWPARRLGPLVVGITGSVGKTSVKDLAAAALGPRWPHRGQRAVFNNELGVPLTLANAPDDTEAVVVEMGAAGPGPHRAAVRRRPTRPSAS